MKAIALLKEEPRKSTRAAVTIGSALAYLAMGAAAAACVLFDQLSPLLSAIVAVAPLSGAIFAVTGAAGMGMIGLSALGIRHLFAALLILGVRWAASPAQRVRKSPYFLIGAAFVIPFATALAFTGARNLALWTVLSAFSEGALSAAGGYFIYRVQQVFERTKPLPLTKAERLCLIILLGLMGVALSQVMLLGISVGHVLGICAVLAFALQGEESGGCMAGVFVGIFASIADPGQLFLTAALGFAGLVGGLFAQFGKIAVGSIFLVTGLTVLALTQPASMFAVYLIELLAGFALFVCIPKKWMQRVRVLGGASGQAPENNLVQSMAQRLQFTSKALWEVSDTVREVSRQLERTGPPDLTGTLVDASELVCKKCAGSSACWQCKYGETMDSFNHAAKRMAARGRLLATDFDHVFLSRCVQPQRLADSATFLYRQTVLKNRDREKIGYVKQAVCDQFASASELLCEVADDISSCQRSEPVIEEALRQLTGAYCSYHFTVSCVADRYDRLFIDILLTKADHQKLDEAFYQAAARAAGRLLAEPCTALCGETVRLSMFEKTTLQTRWERVQYPFKNSRYCGDQTECFVTGGARSYCVLADGMGKGAPAAVDGTMAARLFSKLLQAGFDPPSALKTVNAALIGKSESESLATIDVTEIDLFTGQARFFKAGAAQTFVIKGSRVVKLESQSQPAGILPGAAFDVAQMKLSAGDKVVMLSDGATGDDEEWIAPFLEENRRADCGALAKMVADHAKGVLGNEDDITVLAKEVGKGV